MAFKLLSRGYLLCIFVAALLHHYPHMGYTALWSISQFLPSIHHRNQWQERAWKHWEQHDLHDRRGNGKLNEPFFTTKQLEIPVVEVHKHRHDLSTFLEETYGRDWRKRPLLLRGLWTRSDLRNTSRKLSLQGLLQEELSIPYFSDARVKGALTPDRVGKTRDIVRNITHGAPHKIGTQHLVQAYPKLIREVAPDGVVTSLFGKYFEPNMLQGSGPFGIFPAMTTVPVFVAHMKANRKWAGGKDGSNRARPFTGLHCEPIGNVAVQLSGQKQWTLVSPEYSHLIRPSLAPDGRAFFTSNADLESFEKRHVPLYSAVTQAGDAMWVPTWTWHRVDYLPSKEIAIGGSLFHFRPTDFVANNPLFAAMIVPALILELVGYNTQ